MSNEDKELLRHATLEVLAARHPAALSVPGVLRRVRVEVGFMVPEPELVSALELLYEQGLVRWEQDDLGASKYWLATGKGVVFIERGSPPSAPQRLRD